MGTNPTSRDPSIISSGTKPGDEAKLGMPGPGESVCPDCQGMGLIEAKPCQTCAGTGKVIEAIGRAERRLV